MHPFILERPRDVAAALALRAQAGRTDAPAEYIAGGTDMVQLLAEQVEHRRARVHGEVVILAVDAQPDVRFHRVRTLPTHARPTA